MPKKKKRKKKKLTARTADRQILYQESVQAPEEDSRFFAQYYKKYTGNPLRIFREDFCGSAILACQFVRLHRENRAIGVDLHRPTLDWAYEHNVSRLEEDEKQRIELIESNVLTVRSPKADLLAALNFSYCVFKTREDVGLYIKNAYRSLKPGGLFVMDAWGGGEAQFVQKEKRKLKGFTYVWDQADFDPVTNHILCKIHFRFPDGTRLKNAFTYDWRLWMLPELRELMDDAGFKDVHVLWEGTDKDGEGDGDFKRVERGGDEDAWIAYIIGQK